MSLLDDNRLAPMLDVDDAALWNNTWDDLFSLDLPPLQDTSPSRAYAQEPSEAENVTPTRPQHYHPKDEGDSVDKRQSFTIQRSTVPLAEVLNEEQAEPTQSSSQDKTDFRSPRKRRRLDRDGDWTGNLHLPQPLLTRAQEPQVPAIPPLLQGLHEPPPTAGLFPRITDKPSPTWPLQPSTFQIMAKIDDSQCNNNVGRSSHPERHERHELESLSKLRLRPDTESSVAALEGPGLQPDASSAAISQSSAPDARSKAPSSRRCQAALSRIKWTEQESLDLRAGIQKHGMGNWKKILSDHQFSFHNRTAVDLKDHHRVCVSREKRAQAMASRGSSASKCTSTSARGLRNDSPNRARTSGTHRSKPALGIIQTGAADCGIESGQHEDDEEPAEVMLRRRGMRFTKTEDQALLKGFERHGNAWAKIRNDDDLGLLRRQPRDLRDRMRHKWPEKYERPGLKGKKGKTTTDDGAVMGEKALPITSNEWSRDEHSRPRSTHTVAMDHAPRYIDPVRTLKVT